MIATLSWATQLAIVPDHDSPQQISYRRQYNYHRRVGHASPRNAINSLAAAAPARFAPMVEAEGP